MLIFNKGTSVWHESRSYANTLKMWAKKKAYWETIKRSGYISAANLSNLGYGWPHAYHCDNKRWIALELDAAGIKSQINKKFDPHGGRVYLVEDVEKIAYKDIHKTIDSMIQKMEPRYYYFNGKVAKVIFPDGQEFIDPKVEEARMKKVEEKYAQNERETKQMLDNIFDKIKPGVSLQNAIDMCNL